MSKNPKNIRKCVVCQGRTDKSLMLKVVKTKEGEIFIDKDGKLDGRGAYVHNNEECLSKLQTKKSFNYALKARVPDEIYKELKGE